MNIKDAYIHNGDAILKDIKLNGSKLQKLKAGKNSDDTYLIWDDVVDLSPFGASGHNHDDRYFKLTGGKITGPITFEMSNDRKIYINNSDDETYWSLISFQQKGTEYGTLGTAGSTDLQWNGHNLYHAGNLTASVIGGLGTLSNNISGNAATATKATQDGNGKVIADTYLPLSGGTMSNTNVVTNLNADLLDGWHKDEILRKTEDPTSVISLNDVVTSGIDFTSWGFAHSANINNQPWGDGASSAASVVSFGAAFKFQIYSDYNDTSYLYYRSYYANNGWKAWRQFAFIDSNVASASKWANACTITLTGSVTGSVSIDGSKNVSLATTTNHTHTFDSLTDKPTFIRLFYDSGNNYVGARSDYGENMTGDKYLEWWNSAGWVHHKAGKYSVPGGTSSQFLKADGSLDSTAYLPLSGGTLSGSGAELLKLDSSNSSYNAILFKIGGVAKSEFGFTVGKCSYIYDYTSGKYLGVDVDGTPFYGALSGDGKYALLHSGNYNSYAPTLTGTGASGTWSISITGNAKTATISTYASNVGSSGTAGTNYVTASKVISACNWYDTMISSDSDTVINRWSEIVSFVAGFKETPDLATFLSNNYLAKAGGTMTGTLKWKDNNALPQQTSPQYFLCIDAFDNGGTTKWASKSDTLKELTGLTSTAIGDSDEPVYWNGSKFVKAGAYPTKSSWNYDDRYLKLSGGNLTGSLSIQTQDYEKGYATSQQLVINGPNYDANVTLTPQSYPGIGFHMPNRTWANLIWNGSFTGMDGSFNGYVSFYGSGFKKDGSSDNYVLLGGGGHKLLSDLSMTHSHPYSKLVTYSLETGVSVVVTNSGSCIAFSRRSNGEGSKVWIYTGYGATYIRNNITIIDNADTHISLYHCDGSGFVIKNTANNTATITIISNDVPTFTIYDSTIHGDLSENSVKTVSYSGHTHTFASLTSKPTTIAGYGITDAYTKTQIDTKLNGYLSLSGGELTGKTAIIGQNTGASTISADLDALVIANKQSRVASAGYYYPGIAFNHMWNWDANKTYQNSSQAWIGLKLHSTPGSELSYLVFGTKEGTGAADRPIERMSIAPNGDVNIKKNLSVDGSISATTLYENGVRVSVSGHTHSSVGGINAEYLFRLIRTFSGASSNDTWVKIQKSGQYHSGTCLISVYQWGNTCSFIFNINNTYPEKSTLALMSKDTTNLASNFRLSYSPSEDCFYFKIARDYRVRIFGSEIENGMLGEGELVTSTPEDLIECCNISLNSVFDVSSGIDTTFAYSKDGMSYNDYTWLAAWNGYELRRVDKSQFAPAEHQHEKITHTLWSYYDAIPDTTSPADICARFGVSNTRVNAVFTGMVQAPDGTRNQSLFWTNYGAAGLVELTKYYGGDTRLKYRVSAGWDDAGANWSTAGYRELANVEDLTWANIGSKPETATRWPSWGEVTDKPTFTTWSETSSVASYSLSNAAWTNTITLPTTAGSYILNIVSGNSTLTGVFSIGASDNAKDEISLHLHGNGPRLYARTNGTILQLSSNDASATSRSVTIKYRRMI